MYLVLSAFTFSPNSLRATAKASERLLAFQKDWVNGVTSLYDIDDSLFDLVTDTTCYISLGLYTEHNKGEG